LRIGFEFIKQELPSQCYLPNPTWSNHENIIRRSGLNFSAYPYYDPKTQKVNINDLLAHMKNAK